MQGLRIQLWHSLSASQHRNIDDTVDAFLMSFGEAHEVLDGPVECHCVVWMGIIEPSASLVVGMDDFGESS